MSVGLVILSRLKLIPTPGNSVLIEYFIARHKLQVVFDGLRDEQAVEWAFVMEREVLDAEKARQIQRQQSEIKLRHHLLESVLPKV